jgi:hypothetical protein
MTLSELLLYCCGVPCVGCCPLGGCRCDVPEDSVGEPDSFSRLSGGGAGDDDDDDDEVGVFFLGGELSGWERTLR